MFNIRPLTLIVRAIVLLTSIPVHEAAHAWVADKLGDPTAKWRGRLTLNPMAHFDPMGAVAMLIFGIGWAKPVPINPMNFDDRKKGMALSAAAGPLSNLVLATVSLAIAKVVLYLGYATGFGVILTTLYRIFGTMCTINISLAIFNLLPVPPFDGSRIFNYFLSDKYYFKIMEYERYILIGIFVLLYIGVLDGPLSFFNGILFNVIDFATGFVDLAFKFIF